MRKQSAGPFAVRNVLLTHPARNHYMAGNRCMPDKYKLDREEMAALLRELRRIYKRNDEREFMRILRKHGIRDEDPRFAEIVKFFRALQSGKV